jgi:hypothetical protein
MNRAAAPFVDATFASVTFPFASIVTATSI